MPNLKLSPSLSLLLVLASACATATPPPTILPTPDSKATETKIAANVFATMTAGVPTATLTPPKTATPIPTNTPKPTDTLAPTPTMAATVAPQVLSGRGQQVSAKFTLAAGLAIFKMKYLGARNFIVELMDSSGKMVDLLANVIGSYDGATAVGITQPGTFVLNVEASADWTITVEQPNTAGTFAKPPVKLSGRGSQVSPLYTLPTGLVTFRLTHNGARNFIVELLNGRGALVDLLVNKIGVFDGSKAAGISRGGTYLLNITADGDWTVSIE